MPFSLFQKKVLITGSTDGLGKQLAIGLVKQGAYVILHGRSQSKVNSVTKELQSLQPTATIESIVCNLTKPTEITTQFQTISQLDILINNAGVWLEGDTIDAPPEKILELVHVNLAAPLLLTNLLLPKLLQSEFAQILNVSSIAGVEIPSGFYHTIYSATKFGVQAFSEALAKEFDNKNLRVMGYYPGGMETPIFKKAGNTYKQHEPWMFDPQESVDAMIFMLTRDPKINIKRMDLINHLQK